MCLAVGFRSALLMLAIALAGGCVRESPDPPPPPRFELAVAGVPGGRVTSEPPGISCGVVCAARFTRGTVVTLRALPIDGAELAGWGGACHGRALCTLSLVTDQKVSVRFVETGTDVDVPASAVPPSDLDHDGVPDDRDACPVEPSADDSGDGCPR